jgi:magnesium chelatase family protein
MSGPLMDRVDVRVMMQPPNYQQLRGCLEGSETTAVVAERVRRARERAARRLTGTPWRTNADVPGPQLRQRWPIPRQLLREPEALFEKGRLTARGLDRVMRTAWTLADLDDVDLPRKGHVDKALELRMQGGM